MNGYKYGGLHAELDSVLHACDNNGNFRIRGFQLYVRSLEPRNYPRYNYYECLYLGALLINCFFILAHTSFEN